MNATVLQGSRGAYYVEQAAFCRVGTEWNHNDWSAKNNPMGRHALYYRTDHGKTRSVLHMIDGQVELLPDRIYFIPAYSVLYSEIDGDMEKYFIHFQSDAIEFGLYRHISGRCSVPADAMTKPLFNLILNNYQERNAVAERKVCGAMELLMAELLENLAVEPRDVEKFRGILQYIEEHYREKISISQLAGMMNVSSVYFSNAFKSAFHVTPKQYILGKRLFESQFLLAKTELSIREVAEQVGFENENYFSEFFSAKAGISALKFRHQAQRK